MMDHIIKLLSNDIKAIHLIYYLFQKNKDIVKSVDCLLNHYLYHGKYDRDDADDDTDDDGSIYFILGNGNHSLKFNNTDLDISISDVIDKTNNNSIIKTSDMYSEVIKEIIIKTSNFKIIDDLIKESTEYFKEFIKTLENSKTNKIKKYIYEADGYWDYMNKTNKRYIDSLFLKKNEKENLLEYLTNFFNETTKVDYDKFNIPYKSNILLYGKPGTGKTSTILTIASMLNTHIGVIPISREITDSKLVHAFNNVKKKDFKIIVMEDIDCLFIDRKSHDTEKNSITLSGLLNCLDGLCRNEGIIVFLTTNRIDALDDALIRSSRIDYRIEYDFVDEYQTFECYKFYFPNKLDMFDKFYNKIAYKKYTIAMLQEYFFKHRIKGDIIENIQLFDHIIKSNEKIQDKSEEAGHIYM
jgi:SpoVK/Ycf46/Vps4 family AAA+-type ATPase